MMTNCSCKRINFHISNSFDYRVKNGLNNYTKVDLDRAFDTPQFSPKLIDAAKNNCEIQLFQVIK